MNVNKEVQIPTDINISIKKTSKICLEVVNEFWVLLLGVKSEKLGITCGRRKKTKFSWNRQGIMQQLRGMVKIILRR